MVTPIRITRVSSDPEIYPVCTRTPSSTRWRLNCCCCHYSSALKSLSAPPSTAATTPAAPISGVVAATSPSTPAIPPAPLASLPTKCPVAACRHNLCKSGCLFYEQERMWECFSCGAKNGSEKRRCSGMTPRGFCDKPLGGEDCWVWVVGRFPGEAERSQMGDGWENWV